jgi:hypothetical protein
MNASSTAFDGRSFTVSSPTSFKIELGIAEHRRLQENSDRRIKCRCFEFGNSTRNARMSMCTHQFTQ